MFRSVLSPGAPAAVLKEQFMQKDSTYKSEMSIRDTERAIKLIKDTFEDKLAAALNLERVSAPIVVRTSSGLNDDLNGVERKVVFDCPGINGGETVEIVQSLAKWKRMVLDVYGFMPGEGLYTDMNAIRRDEELDNIHSIYVDQWDWEKVIERRDRNIDFLCASVRSIVGAIYETQIVLYTAYPKIEKNFVNTDIHFITSQELADRYPDVDSPKEREDLIAREFGTVFIMQIGGALRSGQTHGGRSPDYDDWSLNGDIIVYNDILGASFELSSMGIRVDAQSLKSQLSAAGCENRMKFTYHQMIASDRLPLTIGGGIGQSRLCMYMLRRHHIGEVQASVWPDAMLDEARVTGIRML